ncbi:DoxX family protein [Patescibacteria group bacterium]|nr:DoxX family protein [Patescibacteria group bacterium]
MIKSSCSSCCTWFHAHGQNIGLFLLRVSMAIIFIYSGYHKLFGDMPAFTGMVAGLGFPAPAFFAWAAALSEFVGGIALLLGVFTRVFSALLVVVMAISIYATEASGFMGMTPAIALLGSSLAVFFTGSGSWSLCQLGRCCLGAWCGCGHETKDCAEEAHECACEGHGKKMKDACCKTKK